MVAEGEGSPRPSLTPDLLADLHGDVLPADEAERVRAAVAADPDARDVLAALDRVRDELVALRTDPAPAPPAPADVMARIGAALDAEPVTDLAARRRRRMVTAVAAAAAVTVVGAGAVALLRDTGSGSSGNDLLAQPTSTTTVLGDDLSAAEVLGMLGRSGGEALHDPSLRAECLRANGFDESTTVLGSGDVTLDGTAGILLLLPGPQPPTITALVVGNGCSADDPATLARTDIG